jgi:hypothetical protein
MNIWDYCDCIGCENKCRGGECAIGASDSLLCYRMLVAVEDLINDGEFVTYSGTVYTRACLEDMPGNWDGVEAAPYWFIPDSTHEPAMSFPSIAEIYRFFFL